MGRAGHAADIIRRLVTRPAEFGIACLTAAHVTFMTCLEQHLWTLKQVLVRHGAPSCLGHDWLRDS